MQDLKVLELYDDNSKDRIDMNVKYDVIGLAMNIPGKKRGENKTSLLTVDL